MRELLLLQRCTCPPFAVGEGAALSITVAVPTAKQKGPAASSDPTVQAWDGVSGTVCCCACKGRSASEQLPGAECGMDARSRFSAGFGACWRNAVSSRTAGLQFAVESYSRLDHHCDND